MSGALAKDLAAVPSAQWQTYAYVSTASDCHPVPHFHDECTAYEAAPWFEKSHQCLTPAPGFNNDCDDLFRTYGKYTEISSTCLPWIEMASVPPMKMGT